MSSNRNYTASEVRSGLFVILSVAILLALLFYCGTSPFIQKSYPLYVRFDYIAGLKKDTPVQLAGNEIGKVTRIRFVEQDTNQVEVTLAIFDGVKVHNDAQVFIEIMGFMGEKYIEIKPGNPKSPLLAPNAILKGENPIPLMEVVHRGVLMMDDFEKISKSMESLVQELETMVGDNKGNIQSIVDNLNASSANLKDLTQDLKWHPWKLFRKGKEKNS